MWECRSFDAPGTRAFRLTQWTLRGPASGEMRMTAIDIVGLLLLVFLIAPMMTARPSRY
jgi:hypothetical protein